MTELQPINSDHIRQIAREELRYTTPQLATVTKAHAHSEKDDDSNYEVGVEILGTGVQAENASASAKTLDRVPVASPMQGATQGLVPGDMVLVQFLDGDSAQPVVTHSVHGAGSSDRAPLTEEGDYRRRLDDGSIIELVHDEDGKRKLNLGRQPDDRDGIDMGLTFNLDDGGFCLMDASQNGLFFDGQGNSILKWESMAMPILAEGDVNFQSGGSSTGSGTDTNQFLSLASGSGMDEAESLAAGMQSTTVPSSAVRQGDDPAGLGLTPRLPTTWTQAALTATQIPEPYVEEVIDLGEKGLRPGDVIDPYLNDHVRSDTRVSIPAGRYQWRGNGLTGNYSNTAIVGRGGLVELQQAEGSNYQETITVTGGGPGSFLLANLAIRGKSRTSGAVLRVQVTDELASALIDGLYLPDGGRKNAAVGLNTVGLGVPRGHAGELHIRNSYIAGFPGGGIHASSPGVAAGADGPVHVAGGFYRSNGLANVRIGSSESTIRAVTVLSDGIDDNPSTARGLWFSEGATAVEVVDCDITQVVTGPALQMGGPGATTAGTVTTTRISNDARTPPIALSPGHSWTGTAVHLTGSGSQSIQGAADGEFETVTGEAAYPATRTPQQID